MIAGISAQMTGREFLETLHRSSGGSNRDSEKKITETMVLLVTPHGISTFYFTEQHTLKPVINHILQRRDGLATVHKARGLDGSPGQTPSWSGRANREIPTDFPFALFMVLCVSFQTFGTGKKKVVKRASSPSNLEAHFSFTEG